MAKYDVGDTLKCVDCGSKGNGWEIGRVFTVRKVTSGVNPIYWPEYDDGGNGDGIYENSVIKVNKTSMIKKLSNFIKKTVNADTQELLKAGLINGDLEPTFQGLAELNQIQWFANIEALVARAKEINAEAEAEAKK